MLAKLVSDNQRDWDNHLATIAFAYRTTVNEVTGFTHFFLLTAGRPGYPPIYALDSHQTTTPDILATQTLLTKCRTACTRHTNWPEITWATVQFATRTRTT